MDNLTKEKSRLIKAVFVLAIIICFYFATKIVSEIRGFNFIGGGIPTSSTISFEGKGEVSAKPDLATITFTLRNEQKELKNAQDSVATKENAVLAFLGTQNINKKDIKTENYSSYPKYDYGIPCYIDKGVGLPCKQEAPKIIGYEVSESISVKIHDLTKAGEIVKGIGTIGVDQMNGPNFSIENEDGLKQQARKMAIDDAKAKAEILSRDLGVRLVRIVNFSESGNYPIMYAEGVAAMKSVAIAPAPTPILPTGENKITSNVTITYEIR